MSVMIAVAVIGVVLAVIGIEVETKNAKASMAANRGIE